MIDTNLFPAGFNNLCETFAANAAQAFGRFLAKNHPGVKRIHLYPEPHTRNRFYLENVRSLTSILHQAGFETSAGLKLEPADLILANNDFTGGVPEEIARSKIPVLPPPSAGWHRRRKSDHFQILGGLIQELAGLLEIDPWLLFPLWSLESAIDLESENCLKRLQRSADELLTRIAQKHREHGIHEEPFLFVKNNAGTYGLGVLPIDSGNELLSLSRRLRDKLRYSKGGRPVTELLLQEGIPTADTLDGHPIEPVVYLIGGEPVGTFFRIHGEKNARENLNAPGMRFACICYHQIEPPTASLSDPNKENLFRTADLLAKVASLAAAIEIGTARQS